MAAEANEGATAEVATSDRCVLEGHILAYDEARNLLVQLFVLFEIFHIGNSRSETRSLFRLSPLANPILLAGTLAAMTVHGVALYTPFFQELLNIQPLRLDEWASLAAMAASKRNRPASMSSSKRLATRRYR